ncbi:MAG: hypothetical protein MUF87_16020 [Anaerolineae bacterium]|jgi:hypothetical protein|nr:hypothetical protein [Anaerolineae bacterium]
MKEFLEPGWSSALIELSLDKTKPYLAEIGFSLPMLPTLQVLIRYYAMTYPYILDLAGRAEHRRNFGASLLKHFGEEYYTLVYNLVYRKTFRWQAKEWQLITLLSTIQIHHPELYLTAFEDKLSFIRDTILDREKQMKPKKRTWNRIADRANKSDWDLYLQNWFKEIPGIMQEYNPAIDFPLLCMEWYRINTLKMIFAQFTPSELPSFVNALKVNYSKYSRLTLENIPELGLNQP